MSFKYFKCWADWSIKGKSEVTPPAPNSSQSNFSSNEEREPRKNTGDIRDDHPLWHKDTLKGAWGEEVADVHSWTNRCLRGVPALSQSGTQEHKCAKVGSPEQGQGWAQESQTLMERTLSLHCLLQYRAKAHFYLLSQRLYQCCSPNPSHSSPAFTQVKTSSVASQYLSMPQGTATLDHFTAMLWVKAQCEHLPGTHHQIPDFSRYSPSMGSMAALSQQTVNNNQGKPHKCCNKYLVL